MLMAADATPFPAVWGTSSLTLLRRSATHHFIDRQPGVDEDAAMIAGDQGAAYLDRARADSFFATLKGRTIAAMAIQAGDFVVDVGCGTGEEVAAMAQAADDVAARGFDLSEQAIAEANES